MGRKVDSRSWIPTLDVSSSLQWEKESSTSISEQLRSLQKIRNCELGYEVDFSGTFEIISPVQNIRWGTNCG